VPARAAAQAASTKPGMPGAVEERRLPNGMRVVVQEDHRTPLVALQLWLEGGEAASPPGQPGVATLAILAMLRGSKHVPAGQYEALLARAGAGTIGYFTTQSGARLGLTIPAHQLALPLWAWSDQMGFYGDGPDDAQLAIVKNRLREQRRSALAAGPYARLDAIAAEEMFPPGHPSRVAFLSPQAVDAIDRAALRAYHDRWITPSHATLVMVGDVAAEQAFALAERYFGPLVSPSGEHTKVPPAVKLAGETQLDVAADVPLAYVSIRWPTPRTLTTDDARLEVVGHVFKGTRTAWLFWKLVDEKKVATGLRAQQVSSDTGSQFEVFINAAPGRSAAEVLAAYDATMDELRKAQVTPKVFQGAAYESVLPRAMGLESAAQRAVELGRYAMLAGTAGYFDHDFERFRKMTPADVREAIDAWLPRDRRVVLLVEPTPGAPPGGEVRARRFTPAGTP